MSRLPDDEPKRDWDAERKADQQRAMWYRMSGLGIEFSLTLGVCLAAGWWLDRKFGTKHWLLSVGAAMGFVVGLTQLVRAAGRMFKD